MFLELFAYLAHNHVIYLYLYLYIYIYIDRYIYIIYVYVYVYIICMASEQRQKLLCIYHMTFQPMESLLDLIRNETTQQYFITYLPAIHSIVLLFHIPVPAPLIVVILSLYSPLVRSIG